MSRYSPSIPVAVSFAGCRAASATTPAASAPSHAPTSSTEICDAGVADAPLPIQLLRPAIAGMPSAELTTSRS